MERVMELQPGMTIGEYRRQASRLIALDQSKPLTQLLNGKEAHNQQDEAQMATGGTTPNRLPESV